MEGESEERNREKEITFKGMGFAALFSSNLCELLYIEKRRRTVVRKGQSSITSKSMLEIKLYFLRYLLLIILAFIKCLRSLI